MPGRPLPFLFDSYAQLDLVRTRLDAQFRREFDEAGYVLLAWGDVGFVHLLTRDVIDGKEALRKLKMWTWTDDVISSEYFKGLEIDGVSLGVPDVLPALSSGKINACHGSLLAAVALQWYSKVSFATRQPVSYSIGALIVRKDVFSFLEPADQAAVLEIGAEVTAELDQVVRKDNERARKAMEKAGITFVDLPEPLRAEMVAKARSTWDLLVGRVYSREILNAVRAALAESPQ